jgi:hypothetical protein
MLLVSLFLAPALLAQTPDSANQGAASPAASAAEVPRLIKFSGTLLDAQDRPMAGPVGVTFALHAQQTGGAALWLETQNVTPDAHGNYTVLLGANSTNGVPAELFASGEARWLEVQVERQAEQPRILLVSVPYALKAKDAETLGGRPASAFLTTETLAGSGSSAGTAAAASTALPSSKTQTTPKKAASAAQPAVACTGLTSDGTAALNSIALFTAPCTIQSSLMTQALINGFPGVSLAGNNAGLLLSGTGTHQLTVTGLSSGRLGQDATGFFFSSDTKGKVIKFLTNNGALNEWMRITDVGNVGIGTTTPAFKLDIIGNQNIAGNLSLTGTANITAFSGAFTGSGGGVLGHDTNLAGATVGVTGISDSTVLGSSGVQGVSTPTTGFVNGVSGFTASSSGAALYGDATSTTGLTNGLHAISASTGGLGVFAEATATTGTTFGVQGNSASTSGTGVYGLAAAASGSTTGVRGQTNSTAGIGVFGAASATSGFSYGVAAQNASTNGIGTDGFAFATTGNTTGTRGLVSSSGGIGVDGQNLSTTGSTATGTRGFSANPNGQGVLGEVDATGGFSIGVHGIVRSSSGTAGFFENLGSTQGGNLLKADFNAATEFNVDAFGNGFFNGNLGVGTAAPALKAQILGDIRIGASGVLGCVQNFSGTALTGTCSSDLRLKKNIQPFSPVLEKLTRLQPVSFYWRADEHPEYHFGPVRNSGLIAQDVEKVFPDLVTTDARGFKMVNYSELPYLMLQAIKELKSENDALKEQNATLGRALQEQQTRLQSIELRLERLPMERIAEVRAPITTPPPLPREQY